MDSAADPTHLKVGELARRSGLTVRTLHHYDEIGLLAPSGRSESGYRLYSQADVARLHSIQALRQFGLALADIGGVLDGAGAAPELVIAQQLQALDREIAHATELRGRLELMREALAKGGEPTVQDWLDVLGEMAAFGKYFSVAEIKAIFAGWRRTEADWQVLQRETRALMAAGIAPDTPDVQPMARRWMSLTLSWMNSDFNLIERWDQMVRREPHAVIGRNAPPQDMIEYIRVAIDLRVAMMRKYFSAEDLGRLRHVSDQDWAALDSAVQRHLAGDPGEDREALVAWWLRLMDQVTGRDAVLRDKILMAASREPLLAAGSPLSVPVRGFLRAELQKRLTLT